MMSIPWPPPRRHQKGCLSTLAALAVVVAAVGLLVS